MAFHYSPKIVTEGLVFYVDAANPKSFVNGNTTWNDLSRSGNNGTLTNGPTFDSSNGGSISFDGLNDYVDTSTINFGQVYTLNFWVKLNDLASRVWVGGVNTSQYHMNFLNGFLYNRVNNNLFNFNTQAQVNQWYNFNLVRNNTSIDCYKNGVFIGNSTNANYNTDFILYRIGSSPSGFYGKGQVSLISFYNKVLTESQIQQNYNALKTRFGL